MKINNLYKLLFLGFISMFCFINVAQAQSKGTKVNATIADEQGIPLSGVNIMAPKGVQTMTNEKGAFEISVSADNSILIQKDGYESQLLTISELAAGVSMQKSLMLASEKDLVDLGFSKKHKRNIVGAVSSITPSEHQTFDNTQRVKDYIEGLLLGVKGSNKIRGMSTTLFVIDGVVGRNPDILNMDEIEQITVLKDANAVALYGNQGKNGVIVITTKRGEINTRKAKVNIRHSIQDPIALPNYLGSVDYMKLYNEAKINDARRKGLTEADVDDQLYKNIEEYDNSTNKYKYPDTDFYSDEYLKSFTNTTDITTEFSGGNENTRYYVNLGWVNNQSLVKLNPDANAGSNRFNIRGNIDFKVNDWITSSIDGVAIISQSKSALTNLLSGGTSFKPNSYSTVLPVSMIDTTGNPALAAQLQSAKIYDGMLLGGTQQYENGPVASTLAGGYRNTNFRMTQFNNSVDFDLGMITEGLSAKTYLSFDFYDAYDITISNDYTVYEPVWDEDRIVGLNNFGQPDLKDQTENVSTRDYYYNYMVYGLLNYKKNIGDHYFDGTFMGYFSSKTSNETIQQDKNAHLGLQLSYSYQQKLLVDFSGAYINSIKLAEGNRGGISPTFGLGYILSEENFIKDLDFVDFLKVKGSAGIIKSDLGIDSYYLYNETYSRGSSFGWADGQSSNKVQSITQGANDVMSFEERIDLNLGFESYLINSIWLEFNYFRTNMDKQLTTLNTIYPSYYNAFRPMDNYNSDIYSGFELGMNYDTKIKDLVVNVGANVMYADAEVSKRDEVYEYEYQYRTGKPTSAIFGLEDEGFYSESDFTTDGNGNSVLADGLAVPSYSTVIPGDLKYVDQNGDEVIDNKDQVHIGQTSNPWSYGINLKLNYKSFTLFALGNGQFGGQSNLSNNYYWVDGSDKYSEIVTGRWTPETAATATFPSLSAQKDSHNMQRSTFWMYDNSYFNISRVQLTYEFNDDICQKLRMKNFSVNVSGRNLMQISESKDIRQLTIGGTPQYRTYTLGLRTTF